MRILQSKKHKFGTYEINKISLSVFDDKRYVQDDSINTIAYFHTDIDSQVTNKNKWFSRMIINDHKKEILTDGHT